MKGPLGDMRLDQRPLVHVLLIAVLGFLVYSNTFHVPFLFDDESSIVKNPVIRDLGNFFFNSSGYNYNPRRFIAFLTFAVNYHIGGLDVSGFHAFNLAVHVANALLVYALVLLTFRTPAMKGSALSTASRSLALFTSLLFVAHPIQTQAVTYIVQRMASLATLFCLLSLLLYAKGSLHLESERPSGRKALFLYALSWVSIVFAMKTKETAFTIPLLVVLYEAIFFHGGKGWKKKLPYLLPVILTLLVIPLDMVNARKPIGELLSDVSEATRVQTDVTRWEYLVTQFRVIATYIRLLLLPVHQNLDYDYPIYRSILSPPAFLSLFFLLGLFAMAIALIRKARRGFDPAFLLMAFGILWFFVTLSTESSLIPIVDVIYEHRVYLPSVGAFLAVGSAFAMVSRKSASGGHPFLPALVAIAAIGILSMATYRRNLDWRDPVTFWGDVVNKSPGKVRPYNNLGASLADANRSEEAIEVFLRAIRVKPDHPEAFYNLGRAYLLTGRYPEAIAMLNKAIEFKPDYSDAYVNLAATYNRAHRFQDAVRILENANPLLKDRVDAHFNLGVAYAFLGKKGEAIRELGIVAASDPQLAAGLESLLRQPDILKR